MTTESEDKTTASWVKEAQKGYIRMGLLILINKKPSHGYEIMKEIDSRTKGMWQPTPGGVYPILRDLEKSGYIKGQWETQKNRKLKVYKITISGQAILKRAIIKQAQIFDNISRLFGELARDVLNIESDIEMPQVPSFFTPFLEDKTESPDLKTLIHVQKHLKKALKNTKERLNKIDRQIAELKKTQKEGSQQPLQ